MSTQQATSYPAEFRRVRLARAREPGHPEGSKEIGYDFLAPLDAAGRVDPAGWRAHRHLCRVVRFRPDEPEDVGHLVRRPGGSWAFHYDILGDEGDESGRRFGDYAFTPGAYVSIVEDDETHTYSVVSVARP